MEDVYEGNEFDDAMDVMLMMRSHCLLDKASELKFLLSGRVRPEVKHYHRSVVPPPYTGTQIKMKSIKDAHCLSKTFSTYAHVPQIMDKKIVNNLSLYPYEFE